MNKNKEKVVGIDLGTTYSAICLHEGGDSKMVVFGDSSTTMPSVVGFEIDEKDNITRVVGSSAKKRSIINAKNTFSSFKTYLSKEDQKYQIFSKKGQVLETFKPYELSGFVLSKLKDEAEKYFNCSVKKAVITVPAYFNDTERVLTQNAAKIAGIECLKIVNEPTAAAIAYGFGKQNSKETVLVYDFGGGTFDVSVVRIEDGVFEVIGKSGNNHLGGDNLDEVLVNWIISEMAAEFGLSESSIKNDVFAMQRLNIAVEECKKELSGMEETYINLPFITKGNDGSPIDLNKKVTRAKFNQLISSLVNETKTYVNEAISEANIQIGDITKVSLVGGSTRVVAVRNMVENMFGKDLIAPNVNPDQVVAIGAAIEAASLSGNIDEEYAPVLLDSVALSYGISETRGLMAVIIKRNTTVPCTKSQYFTNDVDFQPKATIQVLQGNRSFAKDNVEIGNFDIPLTPVKRGMAKIKVEFYLDENQVLKVSAKDEAHSEGGTITIENTLSKEAETEALERAAKFQEQDEKMANRIRKQANIDELQYEIDSLNSTTEDTKIKSELETLKTQCSDLSARINNGEFDDKQEEFDKLITELSSKFYVLKPTKSNSDESKTDLPENKNDSESSNSEVEVEEEKEK